MAYVDVFSDELQLVGILTRSGPEIRLRIDSSRYPEMWVELYWDLHSSGCQVIGRLPDCMVNPGTRTTMSAQAYVEDGVVKIVVSVPDPNGRKHYDLLTASIPNSVQVLMNN